MTCGEGPLRAVFYGNKSPLGSHDVVVNVSNDHGVTWGPGQNLTNWGAKWVSYPSCVASNGVLHLLFLAEVPGTGWRACYYRSDDNGSTWTSKVFPDQVNSGHGTSIAAQGDDVVIRYDWVTPSAPASSAEPVFRWSRDNGVSWGRRSGIPGGLGKSVDAIFDLEVHDGSAYALHFRSPAATVHQRDVYVAVSHQGGPWQDQRIDLDPGLAGDPYYGQLAVFGDQVQAFWIESSRNGVPYTDYRLIQRRSLDRGATWEPEALLAGPPPGSDWLNGVRVGVDPIAGEVLAVSWVEVQVGIGSVGKVRVSHDGGVNFMPSVSLAPGPFGAASFGARDCLVEGPVVAVLGHDRSYLSSSRIRPVLHLSTDRGGTWIGGIPLGEFPPGYEGSSGGAYNPVSVVSHGSFQSVWRLHDGSGNQSRMYVQGIRVPFADASLNGRDLVLHLRGVPSNLIGKTARWALSNIDGSSTHPENPLLRLELGPSRLLSASLSAAGVARLSAPVLPSGEASTAPIRIPVSLPPGIPILTQGWVNPGGRGLPPSDVAFFITP